MLSPRHEAKFLLPFLLFLLSLFAFQTNLKAQCSSIIDLNAWTQEGPIANGTWTVNGPGTVVTQTINSFPTFFVSPQEFINVRITGTLQSTGTDDDFIGFAIGYRDPIGGTGSTFPVETWLFDWKRLTQTVGTSTIQTGQYLSQINGTFDLTVHSPEFWGHQSQNGFNLVASNTGPGTGWVVNAIYNFELSYLASRLVIAIDGDTIFDVPGCFEPGRFGFYNYSQAGTVYSNFAYELIPDFTLSTASVCLGDSAEFQYVSDTCSSSLITNSVVAAWHWNFGNGADTSLLQNPSYLYDSVGTYAVTLIITDNFGCQDSVTRPVDVIACPFPVNYSYFDVLPMGKSAKLQWETVLETENTGFQIWKSEDGQSFSQIAWVPSKNNNSSLSISYAHLDSLVQPGRNYFYRLHQIDQNGNANISEIRQFQLSQPAFPQISAFPNPFYSEVNFKILIPSETDNVHQLSIQIFDIAGIQLFKEEQSIGQNAEVIIDLDHLANGIYFAKIVLDRKQLEVLKVIKK